MAEEILLNITPHEVRVAFVTEGILQEMVIERRLRQGLVGNIYKGKVHRVLPGIQAAFIDIGLERAAFLHVSDLHSKQPDATITDLLQQGQEILIQVYKDSLGSKGVRVTTQLTIPGRFLVFIPGMHELVISQRIMDESVRERLLQMIKPSASGGYIFRTAAIDATQAELVAEQELLAMTWETILTRRKLAKAGELIYTDISIELRLLRDRVTDSTAKIRVDHLNTVSEMREFAKQSMPHLIERIEYHESKQPLFDIYSVETQLQKALHRKVYLKSGGHLIFDQTEAMTTIDVNTGSYLGHGNQEDTIFKTNIEAITAIAHQVRLRNLGGIIIIDFIDMSDPQHKVELLKLLTEALAKDTVRTEVSELSSLGLVQLTRKRTRESLERILCVPCPTCQQRGTVKSLETMHSEILRELQQAAKNFSWTGFVIVASISVVEYLCADSAIIKELEQEVGKPVHIRAEPTYTQEHYDILPTKE